MLIRSNVLAEILRTVVSVYLWGQVSLFQVDTSQCVPLFILSNKTHMFAEITTCPVKPPQTKSKVEIKILDWQPSLCVPSCGRVIHHGPAQLCFVFILSKG